MLPLTKLVFVLENIHFDFKILFVLMYNVFVNKYF